MRSVLVLQIESLQANYKISAAVLNLDPRKLVTDALQPVWGLNQKLELLKIAFEVSCCLKRLQQPCSPCNCSPMCCVSLHSKLKYVKFAVL